MKREDLRKLFEVALEVRCAAIAAAEDDLSKEHMRCRKRVAEAHLAFDKEQARLYEMADAIGRLDGVVTSWCGNK